MAASESTTHTDTTTEAVIAYVEIPAGYLNPGDVLEVLGVSEADAANLTDTHKVNLVAYNVGGTQVALATGEALDVASGDAHESRASFIFEAIGALTVATIKGMGTALWSTSGAALTPTAISDATNLATTSAIRIGISVDHSVAHANNQTSCKLLVVKVNGSPV